MFPDILTEKYPVLIRHLKKLQINDNTSQKIVSAFIFALPKIGYNSIANSVERIQV